MNDRVTFSLEEIGQLLTEFSTNKLNIGSWKDEMILNGSKGIIGEIRVKEDWFQLPRDIAVRVIFFYDLDGPVLRWASQDKQLIKEIETVTEKRDNATLNKDLFDAERYNRQLKELHSRIITHESLASYNPIAESGLRSGYITLKANGELIVHAKGNHIFHL